LPSGRARVSRRGKRDRFPGLCHRCPSQWCGFCHRCPSVARGFATGARQWLRQSACVPVRTSKPAPRTTPAGPGLGFSVASAALKEGIENLLEAAPGRIGARHSLAGRRSRAPNRRPHRRSAAAPLAFARDVARARNPSGSAGHQQVARISRRLARAKQATRVRVARVQVARSCASDLPAHHLDSRARWLRAAAARRARWRPADPREADPRNRRRRALRDRRQARFRPPRAIPSATVSTAAATAGSTADLTASRSTRVGPGRGRLPPANKPRGSCARSALLTQTLPRPRPLETPAVRGRAKAQSSPGRHPEEAERTRTVCGNAPTSCPA
jgi:hypothetical protein